MVDKEAAGEIFFGPLDIAQYFLYKAMFPLILCSPIDTVPFCHLCGSQDQNHCNQRQQHELMEKCLLLLTVNWLLEEIELCKKPCYFVELMQRITLGTLLTFEKDQPFTNQVLFYLFFGFDFLGHGRTP